MNLWSPDIYTRAWTFAAHAHRHQTVSGKDMPYIHHVANVAMEVMTAIAASKPVNRPDLAVQCALLHDVIEDCGVTFSQLESSFGTAVAQGVSALSKNPELPTADERMRDSLERIKAQPMEVRMVKLGDRITNLQPPPSFWIRDKIEQYYRESWMIYDALHTANSLLADRLMKKIEDYRRYF